MTTDNDIRALFQDFHPSFDDTAGFMDKLDARLDAVEDAKRYQTSRTRHYWTLSIIAFVIGAACGAFILFVVLCRPESLTQFRLSVEGLLLRIFAFRQFFYGLASLIVLALVLIPVLSSKKPVSLR